MNGKGNAGCFAERDQWLSGCKKSALQSITYILLVQHILWLSHLHGKIISEKMYHRLKICVLLVATIAIRCPCVYCYLLPALTLGKKTHKHLS